MYSGWKGAAEHRKEQKENNRFWDNAQTLQELHTFLAARAMEAIEEREKEGSGEMRLYFR